MFFLPCPFAQVPCCQFHQNMQFAQYIQKMCHWADLSTTNQQSLKITTSHCHVDNDSEFSTSIPGAHVNLDPLYPSDGGFVYNSNDGYFAMPTPLFPLYNRHMLSQRTYLDSIAK